MSQKEFSIVFVVDDDFILVLFHLILPVFTLRIIAGDIFI